MNDGQGTVLRPIIHDYSIGPKSHWILTFRAICCPTICIRRFESSYNFLESILLPPLHETYSFALHPNACQPTESCNYSRLVTQFNFNIIKSYHNIVKSSLSANAYRYILRERIDKFLLLNVLNLSGLIAEYLI